LIIATPELRRSGLDARTAAPLCRDPLKSTTRPNFLATVYLSQIPPIGITWINSSIGDDMLILLIILILVFGFGGYRMGPGLGYYGGGGISLILTIVLILLLLNVI